MTRHSGEEIKSHIWTTLIDIKKITVETLKEKGKKVLVDAVTNEVSKIPIIGGPISKYIEEKYTDDTEIEVQDIEKILEEFGNCEMERFEILVDKLEDISEGIEGYREEIIDIFELVVEGIKDNFEDIIERLSGISELIEEAKKEVIVEVRETGKKIEVKIDRLEEKIEEKKISIKFGKIEDILHKDDMRYDEPAFFREYMGPLWIDFENGYVTRREKEMTKIYEGLKDGFFLIKGGPASGKSVILRYIGYEMSMKEHEVYIIDLKREKPNIEGIAQFQNCYLILDDMHLNTSYVENVLKKKNVMMENNVKLLIGTREIERELIGEYHRELKVLYDSGLSIVARDAVEDIINNFSTLIGVRGDKINTLEMKLEVYNEDLFQLGLALESYKETKNVSKDEILKWVKRSMVDRLKKERNIEGADNIFLLLSVFYQFEIPIYRGFLESEFIGIPNNKINELCMINEIIEDDYGFLSLHHSSRADMFLKAIKKYGLGRNVRNKIGRDFELELLYSYIQAFPSYSLDVIIGLQHIANLTSDKRAKYFLRMLINRKETIDTIKVGIRMTKEPLNYGGNAIIAVGMIDSKAAKEIIRDTKKELKNNVNEFKKPIIDIAGFIYLSSFRNPEIGKLILNVIKDELKNKIKETEESLLDISVSIFNVARGYPEIGKEIVRDSKELLKNKVKKTEEPFSNMGSCFYYINYANHDIAIEIINDTKKELENKVKNSEKPIYSLGKLIAHIYTIEPIVTLEIVKDLKETLKEKVTSLSEPFDDICSGLYDISYVNPEVIREVIRNNKDDLKRRIKESNESIVVIFRGILLIAGFDSEFAENIIIDTKEELNIKVIESKETILSIGEVFYFVYSPDTEFKELFLNIIKENLKRKVKESNENFISKGIGISYINNVNPGIGKEIIRDSKEVLKLKVAESNESFDDINRGISYITRADLEVGRELQKTLDVKIQKHYSNSFYRSV